MGEVYLIRHGQTDFNIQKRLTGHTDIPLNAKGIEEITGLKSAVKDITFDAVYSSDLIRCIQSAKILFDREIISKSSLREINFGKWEGMNIDQLRKMHPSNFEKKLYGIGHFKNSKGESFNEFYKRASDAFKEITKTDRRIAVITHGGFIRAVLARYIANNKNAFGNFSAANGSLTHLFYDKNRFALISCKERS